MVNLRCTRRLLKRVAGVKGAALSPSTTALGDWYCNVVYTRPEQLVICMNERTLLVVLVPAKDFKNVGPQYRAEVIGLLTRIGVPEAAVSAEARQMADLAFGPTASRKVLGCLNEAAFALLDALESGRHTSVAALEDHLSDYIYSTTEYQRPKELALELFAASGVVSGAATPRVH